MEYKYLCTLSELRRTIRRANEKIVICWFSYDDYDVRPHYRTYVRDNAAEYGDKSSISIQTRINYMMRMMN